MVTGENLFAVEAFGASKAWITGFEATLLYTSDGGKTWEFQTPPVRTDYYDICFVTEDEGWIVGKFGTILHTENGGKTWSVQESGIRPVLN